YFANEVFGGTGGGSIEYNSGSCDGWGSGDGGGHYFDSVEFQDSAASEGFAHFFAAATWNSTTDSDCEFIYYKPVDYDLRNGVEDPNGNYSCTAIGHFMEDYCNGDSPYVGLGNEADWLLFLWDLMKSYNSNAENIYDIWDAAQPGQGDWDRFECNDNLRAAAVNLGFSSFLWDLAAAVNGVDH
ncbi:MAG: hypothetical protein KJ042_02795, partial [Deltaproteobacteria bacterium]|nr:hypothetical protein [Deltaproteobacteria bacterium]